MTNADLWGAPRVYVHLVHGTWAKHTDATKRRVTEKLPGWLNTLLPQPPSPKPAWFEPENGFHDALLNAFRNENVIIEGTFSWSGNNSFSARQKAARDLQAKLEEVNASYPGASQIVVAHSHGGTLAALALSHMADYTAATNSVHDLICMSTPFLYLQPHSGPDRGRTALALGSVFSTVVNLCFIWAGTVHQLTPWAAVAAMSSIFICSTVFALLTTYWKGAKYDTWRPLPHGLRVHLLRTTRDEASLIIGFAQTIHWIGSGLFSPKRLRINMLQLFAAFAAYLSLTQFALFAGIKGPPLICFACLLALTLLPLIYLVSLCALMIATGMRDPREWGKQIVEVENAPMERRSELTIFREGDDLAPGLRHTQVYNFPGVRRTVIDLIRNELVRQKAVENSSQDPSRTPTTKSQPPETPALLPNEDIPKTDVRGSDTLSHSTLR